MSSIKDLKNKGFYSLQYPADLRAAVIETAEAWKRFCALPTEVKLSLPYSNGGAGIGYELKNGVGKNADRKENFDVTIEGRAWLERNAAQIGEPTALDFIRKATDLVKVMKPTILQFAKEAEEEFGLEGFKSEIEESEPTFFTRFIHYAADREIGEETATAHVDQSGFTLHLFESEPGLQCLSYDSAWQDMPVSEGETVIIPDMQMQLRSHGELRALCHRVVATKVTAKEPRDSAVVFVQFKNTPKYDKDGQGRLQERKPGFNYNMPIEEFKIMFK